jgi:hypothetical protein
MTKSGREILTLKVAIPKNAVYEKYRGHRNLIKTAVQTSKMRKQGWTRSHYHHTFCNIVKCVETHFN